MSFMPEVKQFLGENEAYLYKRRLFMAKMWPAIRFAGVSVYFDEGDCTGFKWSNDRDGLVFTFQDSEDEEDVFVPRIWIEADDLKSKIVELREKAEAERLAKTKSEELARLRKSAAALGFDLVEMTESVVAKDARKQA